MRDRQGWPGQGLHEPVRHVQVSGTSPRVAGRSWSMCCGCHGARQRCCPLGSGTGITESPRSLLWKAMAFPFFAPSLFLQCQCVVAVGGELSSVLGTDPSGGLGNHGSALRQGIWVLPQALQHLGGCNAAATDVAHTEGGPQPPLDKAVRVWHRHLWGSSDQEGCGGRGRACRPRISPQAPLCQTRGLLPISKGVAGTNPCGSRRRSAWGCPVLCERRETNPGSICPRWSAAPSSGPGWAARGSTAGTYLPSGAGAWGHVPDRHVQQGQGQGASRT